LQKKELSTFQYSLGQKGFLLLGKSESSTSMPELFSIHSRHDKIFLRNEGPGRFNPANGASTHRAIPGKATPDAGEKTGTDFQKIAAEIIFSKYTPDGIVVNDAMEVVHFHGNNSAYLQLSTGKPSHNLAKLARPGLAFELRSVLYKARKEKKAASKTDIPLMTKGVKRFVTIEAIPLPNTAEPYYLVLFHGHSDATHSPGSRKKKSGKLQNDERSMRIQQLEHELAQARDDMNSITEDQETVNEELQSANEELQSSSEELQSLNEEIETSKEEVQSTNEELVALNQELSALNEQVTEERDYANGVLATVREPLVVLDRHLNVKSVNKSFYETFKLTEKETIGKCLYDLGGGQWDIPSLRKLFDAHSEKMNVVDFEVNDEFGSLGKRHMLLNSREMVKDGGRGKLILLAIEDITERRKAEEVLRNNEERFKQLVKDLPAAVYSCDTTGLITYYNNAAVKIWGREPELGKDLWCGSWKMLSPDGSYLPHEVCPMAIAVKERRAITGEEIIIERTDGSRSIVQVYPQPVFNLSGDVTGAINMAIDITAEKEASNKIKHSEEDLRQLTESLEKTVSERTNELQRANESLQKNNDQLSTLNKELESFAYISSHDLQEPLRKIQILSSRILHKDFEALSDQGKDSFNRMRDAAQRMQSLIRDLLSYSHSSADSNKFESKNLNVVLQKVIDEFHEVIVDKGATVEIESLGNASILPFQFHQLVANLIANSLKFSISGIAPQIVIKSENALGIDLCKENSDLKSGALNDSTYYCHISVSDNGIGFEPEYREKIFEVFRRLHTADAYPGTGIGLAIVKRIFENHRGVITAKSELKNGATFDIYIPHSPES
jgi:two-component system CheB/CheR fusion protein